MKDNKAQKIRDIQHFGEEGGVVPVIDHAATSTFLNPNDMQKVFEGEIQPLEMTMKMKRFRKFMAMVNSVN